MRLRPLPQSTNRNFGHKHACARTSEQQRAPTDFEAQTDAYASCFSARPVWCVLLLSVRSSVAILSQHRLENLQRKSGKQFGSGAHSITSCGIRTDMYMFILSSRVIRCPLSVASQSGASESMFPNRLHRRLAHPRYQKTYTVLSLIHISEPTRPY